MRSYGILQPFNLDWRVVAPRDFETLELFLTPKLSIVLRDVVATRVESGRQGGVFRIGAYILQSNDQTKFLREIMPQRSDERIEMAFKDPEISAFFTYEEGESLRELFERQQFICREIHIIANDRPTDLASLNRSDFERVVDWFSANFVTGSIHFEEYETMLKNLQAEMEEQAYKRIQDEMKQKQAKSGPTKRTLWIKSAIAAGCVAASFMMSEFGKKLANRGTVMGMIGGAVCAVIGAGFGMLGRWLGGQVVQHVKVGMVYG